MNNKKLKDKTSETAELAVFVEGQKYIIDADYNNGGLIELIKIYGKHFCLVRCTETGSEWETMLRRLSVPNDS